MFFRIVYSLLYVLVSIFFPFKIIGKEKIPEGAALVCGNHSAYIDIVYVYFALGRKTRRSVMAKKELFRFPVFSALIKKMGAFPVTRDGTDITALRLSLKLLSDGQKLIIFPEGTRVAEDDHADAKGGAGLLAHRSDCPIVPIFIPQSKRMFRRTTIIVGDPFRVAAPSGRPGREDFQRASEEIYERIFSLRDCV